MSAGLNLEERAIAGLHRFLAEEVLAQHAPAPARAVDLGAGSGAFALRLARAGYEVLAVDVDADGFRAPVPFRQIDLNEPDFAARLGEAGFDLVTAVEVIEHLESPIGFLRNVAALLGPRGTAVITTPNVNNAPARLQFLLEGTIRGLDTAGEVTHITPIFHDLLVRQWLPRVGLRLVQRMGYPTHGFPLSRQRYQLLLALLQRALCGAALAGDSAIFVLRRASA